MAARHLPLNSVPTTTTGATTTRAPRRAADFAIVTGAWVVVVIVAAAFPLNDPRVARVALFVHLISMAVGFGAVVMIDAYGLLWLFGYRTLSELVTLASVAHGLIAGAVGGLLASGIALRPDLTTPLAVVKMALVLALMLNGVAAQQLLHRMKMTMPPAVRGASIPWAEFQRGLAAALISQATWWGSIAIGFITTVNRHSFPH